MPSVYTHACTSLDSHDGLDSYSYHTLHHGAMEDVFVKLYIGRVLSFYANEELEPRMVDGVRLMTAFLPGNTYGMNWLLATHHVNNNHRNHMR